MKQLFILADKIEAKLKKIANYPDVPSVKKVLDNVYSDLRSNPALKGTKGISPYIDVAIRIGEPIVVTFQVITDEKSYQYLSSEPAKTNIVNVVKPAVETALKQAFNHFDFVARVGIVI